jgi:predicted DNA-binding transcriptional regulator YafY
MPKRVDSLETVRAILALLRYIPRQSKISAAELQAKLKDEGIVCDLRTVQRHLKTLVSRYEIECDPRSKPYGYKWQANAKAMTLPGLTAQQSLLLCLAEQQLRNLLPASLMKSMADFFAQARSNTSPTSSAQKEREWLAKVRVISETLAFLPAKIANGVFEEVSNALYANAWLKVEYANYAGKRSEAEVMPLGLAQQGPRLYLVCRFDGYENERNLALHRIKTAHKLERTFQRPKDFELAAYDGDGRFGFGEGKRIRLSFLIDKELGIYLEECPLSKDQQILAVRGKLKVSASVVETVQLNRWLLGFGDQISNIKKQRLA